MGLKIDVTTVSRVLLKDGAWYAVLPGSLTMDAMEWTDLKACRFQPKFLRLTRQWAFGSKQGA